MCYVKLYVICHLSYRAEDEEEHGERKEDWEFIMPAQENEFLLYAFIDRCSEVRCKFPS